MKRERPAAGADDDAKQEAEAGDASLLGRFAAAWGRSAAAAAAAVAVCLLLLWLNGCSPADSETPFGGDGRSSSARSASPTVPPDRAAGTGSSDVARPLPSASAELSPGAPSATAARRDQGVNMGSPLRVPSAPAVDGSPQPAAVRRNAAEPAPPAPAETADSRWKAVEQRYGAAANYADRGVVEERRGGNVVRAEFQTRFDRASGQFLLTYRANGRGYTISRDADGECWVDDTAADERLARPELAAALQVAKRLTKSTTIISPGMLLSDGPELPAFLRSVSKWDSQGPERLRGQPCHRLRADLFDGGSHIELWIGADVSLRRVRLTESSIGRWTTWDFQPRFDQPLPPGSFEPPR